MKQNAFVEYVARDLLSKLSGVSARAMFGGYGLYQDGVIFGIIVDDTLYFKADETNRKKYEAAGSAPFTYESTGRKKAVMSYWQVPAEVMEDKTAAAAWAEESRRINLEKKSEPRRRKT